MWNSFAFEFIMVLGSFLAIYRRPQTVQELPPHTPKFDWETRFNFSSFSWVSHAQLLLLWQQKRIKVWKGRDIVFLNYAIPRLVVHAKTKAFLSSDLNMWRAYCLAVRHGTPYEITVWGFRLEEHMITTGKERSPHGPIIKWSLGACSGWSLEYSANTSSYSVFCKECRTKRAPSVRSSGSIDLYCLAFRNKMPLM